MRSADFCRRSSRSRAKYQTEEPLLVGSVPVNDTPTEHGDINPRYTSSHLPSQERIEGQKWQSFTPPRPYKLAATWTNLSPPFSANPDEDEFVWHPPNRTKGTIPSIGSIRFKGKYRLTTHPQQNRQVRQTWQPVRTGAKGTIVGARASFSHHTYRCQITITV